MTFLKFVYSGLYINAGNLAVGPGPLLRALLRGRVYFQSVYLYSARLNGEQK